MVIDKLIVTIKKAPVFPELSFTKFRQFVYHIWTLALSGRYILSDGFTLKTS